MTLYIGVDIHARQQTVSYLDTEDGSIGQQELHHERDDIRGFYSQFQGEVVIGIEACGYTNWFAVSCNLFVAAFRSMRFVPFMQQSLLLVRINTSFQFFIQAICFAPS
jgi:hypothetical protein